MASFQAQRATLDDRKAMIGQSIAKDVKVRNFLRPDYWVYANSAPAVKAQNSIGLFVDGSGNNISLPPVAIDPLMIASMNASFSGSVNTTGWFATNGGALAMPRITLSNPFPPSMSGNDGVGLLGPAATQACMNQDDLVFSLAPNNGDQLPVGGYNNNLTKRLANGQFSWLATLVPAYGDTQTTYNKNMMIMSTVVFNQRRLQSAPANNPTLPTDTERAATVQFAGGGYGGGDLVVTGTVPANASNNFPTLAIGEWIMLGWMVNDQPSTTNAGTYGPRPFFRWYRVVTATPVAVNRSSWQRYVTVNGADVNLNSLAPVSNVQAYAFIYDGAVAVYERPVRLEGPSMWSLY